MNDIRLLVCRVERLLAEVGRLALVVQRKVPEEPDFGGSADRLADVARQVGMALDQQLAGLRSALASGSKVDLQVAGGLMREALRAPLRGLTHEIEAVSLLATSMVPDACTVRPLYLQGTDPLLVTRRTVAAATTCHGVPALRAIAARPTLPNPGAVRGRPPGHAGPRKSTR